jgi:DNA-binding PadR family transcriptional regulator
MIKNKTFITSDQKDGDGKIVDKIYTITEEETETRKFIRSLSGTEVLYLIDLLQEKENNLTLELAEVKEEINFYKNLK